jgi:hypothetical protein|tara:strand:- start:64 stop:786 length:723 start_codon:yes stop_codon:yes gene_type:complete
MKIMVSVTNSKEAQDAMNGGADIIDVKNPVEGALGANLPWITRNIRNAVGKLEEVSVTLGDMPYLPGTASLAALGAALLRVNYVKIGMLGPKNMEEALHISNSLVKTFEEFKVNIKIIIAGYADYQSHNCVSPLELPKVAAESGAWGILVDVKEKHGEGLFSHLSSKDLQKIVDDSHNLGLVVALAGSLGKEDIQKISNLGADIMGVRRGVSLSKEGISTIDRNKVRDLVNTMYPINSSV